MATKYDDQARQSLEGFETVKIDSGANIERLIIDKSAEKELSAATDELKRSIDQAINSFSREKLYPKLEFTNIREQGLRIWGREENLAISQFTMSQILHELASICDSDKLGFALYRAGCKSALQFFADFLPHLIINQELRLPDNEIEFLGLMGSFDQRSAWWSEKPRYEEDEKYYVGLYKRPFTSFPWSDNDMHTFNDFVCAYLQTLFNCSSDFLRVIHWINGKAFKPKYCVYSSFEQMIRPEFLHVRLFATDKYIPDFEEIDRIIYDSYKGFITGTHGKPNIDLAESPEYYSDLVARLKDAFGEAVNYDQDLWKELSKRKERI